MRAARPLACGLLSAVALNAPAIPLDEVQLLREEIAHLRAQIAWLKQKLFGGGQSEKLDRAQLLLKLGELEKLATVERPSATITYERAAGAAAPRGPAAEHFAHLPVRETVEIIPPAVQAQPEAYKKIGEERTFEVDVVRPKFKRRDDRTQAPLIAPAPVRAVAGGYASAGLLAWIALSKYVDHAPFYRLEQMSRRWSAAISRQTMADWIGITAEWLLEPSYCRTSYRQMYRELLQGGYIQADETPLRCNDPDDGARQRGEGAALSAAKGEPSGCPQGGPRGKQRRGGTSQGWLWVISKPGGDVVFDWRLSRRHGELTSLLKDYRGGLQSDGGECAASPATKRIRASRARTRRWCGSAAGRMPGVTSSRPSPNGRRPCSACCNSSAGSINSSASGTQRTSARSAPRCGRNILPGPSRGCGGSCWRLCARVFPKSGLGKVCAYLLAHWEPLVAHQQHAVTRLDNNLVENAIRPSAIGKKNWLFIGHPDAGQRSAIITRSSSPASATARIRSLTFAMCSRGCPR